MGGEGGEEGLDHPPVAGEHPWMSPHPPLQLHLLPEKGLEKEKFPPIKGLQPGRPPGLNWQKNRLLQNRSSPPEVGRSFPRSVMVKWYSIEDRSPELQPPQSLHWILLVGVGVGELVPLYLSPSLMWVQRRLLNAVDFEEHH